MEPGRWVRVLYKAKMRRVGDQEAVMRLYKEEFEPEYPLEDEGGGLYLATDQVNPWHVSLSRVEGQGSYKGWEANLQLLAGQKGLLQLVAGCVKQVGKSNFNESSYFHYLRPGQLC